VATSDGPPQPPIRREVIDALQRLRPSQGRQLFVSRRARKLLSTATPAELLTADLEALWDTPKVDNLVEMADGTMATLPPDPERS
jgi:hypothetical protein